METVTLWHGDCLKLMKNIPDGGVDFVLTDIPYDGVNREETLSALNLMRDISI